MVRIISFRIVRLIVVCTCAIVVLCVIPLLTTANTSQSSPVPAAQNPVEKSTQHLATLPQSGQATHYAYMPVVRGPLVQPNNNPCTAIVATPGTKYTGGIPASEYDFYRLNMPINGTIFMTVSNYLGPRGQLQLRGDKVNASCLPTSTTVLIGTDYVGMPPSPNSVQAYSLTLGTYYARISSDVPLTKPYTFVWSYAATTGLMEPNENSCQAWPIDLGTVYQKYPQDAEDWFGFDVVMTTALQINVTNYTGSGAQVQLFQQGADCSQNGSPIIYAPISGNPGSLAMTTANPVAPGHYFVRVYTGGGYNITTLYTLQVNLSQGIWAPSFNAGNNGHARKAGDGSFYVIYTWTGTPGANHIHFHWAGQALFTCGAGPSFDTDITDLATIQSGQYQFNNLSTGYTVINIDAWRDTDGKHFTDQQNIKVNCDPPGLNLYPQWPAKVTAVPPGPVVPSTPTPVPPPVLAPAVRPTPEP
jgi:hypothetical protein